MKLKNFKSLKIRDIDGEEITFSNMISICRKSTKRGLGIFVGSDSQKVFFNKVNMVTSVCLHHQTGCNGFLCKAKV